jgi:hypothetical protein
MSVRAPIQGLTSGFREIGRTTLAVEADVITVNLPTDYRYLELLIHLIGTGTVTTVLTFNNDTGANYSFRRSNDGGADTTGVSQTSIAISASAASTIVAARLIITNLLANEKLVEGTIGTFTTAGAGTAPTTKRDQIGKWANTSARVNRIDITQTDTGGLAANSEVVVLGLA